MGDDTTNPAQAASDFVDSIIEEHYDNLMMGSVLNRLSRDIHKSNLAAGWWDNVPEGDWAVYTNLTKLDLVHSEISEATEGLRKGLMDDHLPHRPMAEVELADAMIRIFDLAGRLGYDLGGALVEKWKYNLSREDHKREVRAAKGGKSV